LFLASLLTHCFLRHDLRTPETLPLVKNADYPDSTGTLLGGEPPNSTDDLQSPSTAILTHTVLVTFCRCDKIPVKTLKRGRIYFGSQFQRFIPWSAGCIVLRQCRNIMWKGTVEENCSPHGSQEAEKDRKGPGTRYLSKQCQCHFPWEAFLITPPTPRKVLS
jgi:hypothetical protein